ncbi:MAG: hypothetical protein QW706_08290 [Candidatus Nezhaarchaeales archaeon]
MVDAPMSKGISELVALLMLVGVTSAVFLAILYVVPAYFRSYAAMGVEYGYRLTSVGVSTNGHLKRVGSQLVVFVYNYGDRPTTVSYRVTCTSGGTSTYVGGEDNVYVGRNSLYVKVYSNAPAGVCYLVVEEPNLVIYKVVES